MLIMSFLLYVLLIYISYVSLVTKTILPSDVVNLLANQISKFSFCTQLRNA